MKQAGRSVLAVNAEAEFEGPKIHTGDPVLNICSNCRGIVC